MNVLHELMAIKRFREGQAELAVTRQRRALAEAERARLEAQARLEEYRQWALQYEHALYQDLCSRLVRPSEIEDVLEHVAGMREGEHDHEARLEEAAEQVRRVSEDLAQCREAHREASRMVEKFVQLVSQHAAEELRENQRLEDLEMEEAASVARDHDEWQQHGDYEPA
ncbi:YscO family type III secretion system apparatus protein [bacterium SGD-2]|nr:YscO family type III secretion system apparatus protein [bacterium SGD-2]